MMKFTLTACVALIVTAAPTLGAQASSEQRCSEYAKVAVAQFHKYTAIPGCLDPAPYPRWHANYDMHYQWCIYGPDSAADFEQDFRQQTLAECKAQSRR